jgi:hypothetical protein
MFSNQRNPASEAELAERMASMLAEQGRENLPGFLAKKNSDPDILKWISDQESRLEASVRDADEVLFEQAAGAWLKACWRVNELVAEDYRQAHLDPEQWELRFFKWMTKVSFIRFECQWGEFFVVPRKPRRRPNAKHWFTADEMIDILNSPVTTQAIVAFGQLPIRPDDIPHPAPGEKHLDIDFTGEAPVIRYIFRGGPRR